MLDINVRHKCPSEIIRGHWLCSSCSRFYVHRGSIASRDHLKAGHDISQAGIHSPTLYSRSS